LELTDSEIAQRLTGVEINEVWSSLIQTEIALLYWPVLIRWNIRVDQWIKIFILVSSATAFATMNWVVHHPYKWQIITGIIGVFSIVQLILDFASNVNEMNQVYERAVELQCDYEELFRELPDTPRRKAIKRYNSIKREEVDIAKRSAKFTRYTWLRNRCYTEALQARGLVSPIAKKKRKLKRWLILKMFRLIRRSFSKTRLPSRRV
jgi:hypothetical protein